MPRMPFGGDFVQVLSVVRVVTCQGCRFGKDVALGRLCRRHFAT